MFDVIILASQRYPGLFNVHYVTSGERLLFCLPVSAISIFEVSCQRSLHRG